MAQRVFLHHIILILEQATQWQIIAQATSGEKGVEAAIAEKPDMILMDIVMPGMNGFQATRKISTNNETKDIPIIIVTTKDQETDRVWGLRQGAKDYLTKPVDEKMLIEKINALLAG